MDRKTLAALRRCIRKYERAARASDDTFASGEFTFDSRDCALCDLHLCEEFIHMCDTCPVKLRTKQHGCRGTPWWGNGTAAALKFTRGKSFAPRLDLAQIAFEIRTSCYSPDDRRVVCDHLRKRCKEEAEFLKSLLPQWTRNKSKQI